MSDQYGVKDAACPISTKGWGVGGVELFLLAAACRGVLRACQRVRQRASRGTPCRGQAASSGRRRRPRQP